MTPKQKQVLGLVAKRRVDAFCDNRGWYFQSEGEVINRRTVWALKDAGLVEISDYSCGQAINVTDAGRAALVA